MANNHRTVRVSPAVMENPEEVERFTAWVNQPSTRRYIQIVHDSMIGKPIDPDNPLAPQAALILHSKESGALAALKLLMNLDDTDAQKMIDSGEIEATWGMN